MTCPTYRVTVLGPAALLIPVVTESTRSRHRLPFTARGGHRRHTSWSSDNAPIHSAAFPQEDPLPDCGESQQGAFYRPCFGSGTVSAKPHLRHPQGRRGRQPQCGCDVRQPRHGGADTHPRVRGVLGATEPREWAELDG